MLLLEYEYIHNIISGDDFSLSAIGEFDEPLYGARNENGVYAGFSGNTMLFSTLLVSVAVSVISIVFFDGESL